MAEKEITLAEFKELQEIEDLKTAIQHEETALALMKKRLSEKEKSVSTKHSEDTLVLRISQKTGDELIAKN